MNGGERWLIFDNGKHRGWSRVIEVDPDRGEVTWSYPPDGARTLFSEVRGFAQRLPGGTTLITESERGHVLEVNRAGDLLSPAPRGCGLRCESESGGHLPRKGLSGNHLAEQEGARRS